MSEISTETLSPEARHALDLVHARQNLPAAALVGAAAAGLLALAWAGITAATDYQIGYMAVAVGLAVGFAVRVAGHGVDARFRTLGALFALLGCAGGNLLVGCIFFARVQEVGVLRVLEVLDVGLAGYLMQTMFSPMDVLFYGIAVWEGWRLSVVEA